MTLDALGMGTPLDAVETPFGTYPRFAFRVDELYPAALADMRDNDLITDAEMALAKTPRDDVQASQVATRAAILERARHHFTNRLIEQNGPGVGLRILKETDEGESAWRL